MADDRNDTLVVLVHGFRRRGRHLEVWQARLRQDFPEVRTVDLPASHRSFAACLAELERQMAGWRADSRRRLLMAGHSMGGLLMREYLARHRPPNAVRAVCVGTPHRGSRLADIALWLPGAALLYPPLWALRTGARKKITTPAIDGLAIGNIIGTVNGHWPGRRFLSPACDGLVEIAAAEAPDVAETCYFPIKHDALQYAPEVAAAVACFLKNGSFRVE